MKHTLTKSEDAHSVCWGKWEQTLAISFCNLRFTKLINRSQLGNQNKDIYFKKKCWLVWKILRWRNEFWRWDKTFDYVFQVRPWQRSKIRMKEWVGLNLDEKRRRLHCCVSKSRQKSRWWEGGRGPRARGRKLSAGWGKPHRETLCGVDVYADQSGC